MIDLNTSENEAVKVKINLKSTSDINNKFYLSQIKYMCSPQNSNSNTIETVHHQANHLTKRVFNLDKLDFGNLIYSD